MVQNILMDFFCKPIETFAGYNPVNTLVYAAILIAVAFFVVFPFFEKRGIKFDARFAFAVLPFVLLGSSLRVLEDLKIFPRNCNPLDWGFYTISPGIYIAIGLLTIASLALSIFIAKKTGKKTLTIFTGIGIIFAVPPIVFVLTKFKVINGFLAILLLASAITALSIFAFKKMKFQLLKEKINRLALFAQMLDASATFIALQFYNCSEQHFVPAFLIENIGAWSFIIAKFAITIALLYYIDREIKNKNLAGFVKTIIIILGFATGTRDALTVAVGTCL